MITQEEYQKAVEAKEDAEETINAFHKQKFKVGDRVRLRGSKHKGEIVELDGKLAKVLWDTRDPSVNLFHHVECLIRLVKRPRREFWIEIDSTGHVKWGRDHKFVHGSENEVIHVKEVRRKTK